MGEMYAGVSAGAWAPDGEYRARWADGESSVKRNLKKEEEEWPRLLGPGKRRGRRGGGRFERTDRGAHTQTQTDTHMHTEARKRRWQEAAEEGEGEARIHARSSTESEVAAALRCLPREGASLIGFVEGSRTEWTRNEGNS